MILSDLQTPSLRAYLYLGVGLVGAAVLAVVLGIAMYLSGRIEEQSDAQIRILSRNRAQQALSSALLRQEAGLQGYLAYGGLQELQTYREGRQEQEESLHAVTENLLSSQRKALEPLLKRLEAATDDWEVVSTNLITRREKGAIPDLSGVLASQKQAFERVQGVTYDLQAFLSRQDDSELGQVEQALSNARWMSFWFIGTVLLGGFFGIRMLITRVTEPLVALSDYAHEDNGFPEEVQEYGVRELKILGGALRELDHRVRDRETKLKEEGEDAEMSQLYLSLVQKLGSESEILNAFVQALQRMLRPDVLRILLVSSESSNLEWYFSSEGAAWDEAEPTPRILTEPMTCRAIHQGSLVCNKADSPFACLCRLGVPSRGSHLCLPLIASGQTQGLVVLQSRQTEYWSLSRIRRASSLVSGTASALQVVRALKTAKDMAIRDGLTGVYNRRFLNELLPKQVHQSGRNGHPLSVLMMDIDHFKRFNDEFGHEAGDRVLMAFSQCIQSGVRAADIICRFGGEEFVVLLPETPYPEAMLLAERIRTSVEALPISTLGLPERAQVRTSIGVATLPIHAESGEPLLSIADKALYVAKGCGRNRVVGAGDLGNSLD